MPDFVMGIETGVTYSRGVITDLQGKIIFSSVATGGNLNKSIDTKTNVNDLIKTLLFRSNIPSDHIKMIGAGLAGFDSELDNKWALEFLKYPGLNCPKIIVNDSRVVHEITFNFGPGIIAIADNGSIVRGRNEKGKNISNYDLYHYAYTASRHIAYNAIYKIFSSNRKLPWSSAVFKFFKCDSKTSLYSIIRNFSKDVLDQKIGKLAPLITTYAEEGEPVARSICAAGAKQMMEGIDLVASTFHIDKIPIAFVGSVLQSSFMAEELYRILTEKSVYEFDIKNIPCESVMGGVALALNELNKWDQGLLLNWKSFKLGY